MQEIAQCALADNEINELTEQIAENQTSIEKMQLETEIEKWQEKLNNLPRYETAEQVYKFYSERTSSSFLSTSFAAIITGLLITFLISCFLVFLNYLKKRKTMFQIQYAGGCIAFNVSYYAKAEIDDFQKQLIRTKDLAEESTAKAAAPETPVQTSTQGNVPDDLRKYADLLKDELISQEEYDTMKKENFESVGIDYGCTTRPLPFTAHLKNVKL